MVKRVCNVIKTNRKRGKRPLEDETVPLQKQRPKVFELLRRYPVSTTTIHVVEDASDIDQHENAIKEEEKEAKGYSLTPSYEIHLSQTANVCTE